MKYRVLRRTESACEVEFRHGERRIVLNVGPCDDSDPHYISDRWPHAAFARGESEPCCDDASGPDWKDYAPSPAPPPGRSRIAKLRLARNEDVFDQGACVDDPEIRASDRISGWKQLCVSNLFFNVMCFQKGDVEETHYHPFNHVSFVVGKFHLTLDGRSTMIEGTVADPLLLFVARMKRHRFECLAPGFIACCHAQRMSENVEDILDDALVPNGDIPPEILRGAYPLTVGGPAGAQDAPRKSPNVP